MPIVPDAHTILFERTETGVENSDYAELSLDVVRDIKAQCQV